MNNHIPTKQSTWWMVSVVVVMVFGYTLTVFSAPPATKYTPGETLTPNCAPGDPNCSVIPPAKSGTNDDITQITGLIVPLSIAQGGTATSVAPSLGELLVGNGAGGYVLRATSSLHLNTNDLVEGLNQFYTIARATSAAATYIASSSTVPHVAGGSVGEVLYWNGTSWGSISTSSLGIIGGAFSGNLEDLNDVLTMTKSTGDVFYWNGTGWSNLATSSLHVALSDTTGILPVARGGTGTSTTFSTGSVLFTTASGTSYAADSSNLYWDDTNERMGIGTTSPVDDLTVDGRIGVIHLAGRGAKPTVSAGSGAGTGPTVSVTGTDIAGQVSLTTGALPGLGDLFTVTFASSYTSAPYVMYTPANSAAAVAALSSSLVPSSTTNGFTLSVGTLALNAGTSYVWNYMVVQ